MYEAWEARGAEKLSAVGCRTRSNNVNIHFGSPIEDLGRLLCSKSLHMRLGRLGRLSAGGCQTVLFIDFGRPIEKKLSALEGCYVANPYI